MKANGGDARCAAKAKSSREHSALFPLRQSPSPSLAINQPSLAIIYHTLAIVIELPTHEELAELKMLDFTQETTLYNSERFEPR